MGYYLSRDDLFILVKSMTPGEKRYFRLQSRLYSGNKTYMRLFDLLDQQEEFDEMALKQQLADESSNVNFSVIKKYLFDHIVNALKNYGSYRDPDSDLSNLIETYKILQYKGMDRLSERVLLQAKKKAYEDEAFLRLCYILVRQYIDLSLSTSDETMKTIQDLIEERERAIEMIRNYSFIGDCLYIQRRILRQMGTVRDATIEQKLKKNIEPLLRISNDQLLSRTAEGMYNMTMSDYYFAMGDEKKALHYLSDYISNQSFPKDTSKIEIQYLNEYSYYFNVSLRSMHFEGFEEHLTRFKNLITPRNTPVDIVIFERWLTYSVTYLNITGRFAEAAEHFQLHAETFYKLKDRVSKQNRLNLSYALAYSCFGTGDYERALRHTFNVINEADPDTEVSVFSRILSILIYYETDNWEGLEYATRSVYRYLLKTKRLFRSEKIFLAFIRQLPLLHSNQQLLDRFSELYLELDRIFRDKREAGIEYYIHIRAWLKSKVDGRSLTQCVVEQMNEEGVYR